MDSDTSEISDTICIDLDMNQNKLTPDDFEFGKYLGEGGYGKVYHARKSTGRDQGTIIAMKVIRKRKIVQSPKKIENVESERCILATIEHPFIVKMFYAFETDDTFYLGLEYMCNGDLFNYLERVEILDEGIACLYVAEVILALKYLHENDIVYRDLKPDNILIDADGHIKLSDFGLCKRVAEEDGKAYSFCGTVDYMSPEMVQKRVYNRTVDWWSVGVLLFDMLTGCPPFTVPHNRNMTMHNIKYGLFSFKKSRIEVSIEARDLICKLLKLRPMERLGSGPTDAKELMSHVFFRNIDFDNLLACKYEPLIRRPNEHLIEEQFVRVMHRRSEDERTLSDSDKMIFEDFEYIAPSLLGLEGISDITE